MKSLEVPEYSSPPAGPGGCGWEAAPPSTDYSQHCPSQRDPLCSSLVLTDEESRKGFVGAVGAPSPPRFQGLGHQLHAGSPGTLPETRGDVSPRGVWEQAGTWGKGRKGGWCVCDERAPQGGCQNLVPSPLGHPDTPKPELLSPCECQGLHQAGLPPEALGLPLLLLPRERGLLAPPAKGNPYP